MAPSIDGARAWGDDGGGNDGESLEWRDRDSGRGAWRGKTMAHMWTPTMKTYRVVEIICANTRHRW